MKQSRILAFETSHTPGQVALLESDRIVWQESLPHGRRTTETFALVIQRALRERSWKPADVEWVAVSRGPGSFTGLRIGITAAKVFALTTGCGVLSVDTMELVADQVPQPYDRFWVVLDAQRQQLCVRAFARDASGVVVSTAKDTIVDGVTWFADRTSDEVLTGSGLQRWLDRMQTPATIVNRDLWVPQAATLGRRAYDQMKRGESDDKWLLAPVYYRPSAAEEKAM